jgi:hypothetical protein
MRKFLLATLAVAAIATSSTAAFAGDQDFTLVNKTGYQIDCSCCRSMISGSG